MFQKNFVDRAQVQTKILSCFLSFCSGRAVKYTLILKTKKQGAARIKSAWYNTQVKRILGFIGGCGLIFDSLWDFITKCNSYFITKCGKSLLHNTPVFCYKMQQFCYKKRQLLQKATILLQHVAFVTKGVSTQCAKSLLKCFPYSRVSLVHVRDTFTTKYKSLALSSRYFIVKIIATISNSILF